MAGNQALRAVAERELIETPTQVENEPEAGISLKILLTALTALSQRFIVALSRLFTLTTIASAFVLWFNVLPSPTIPQLVGLGLYAVFIVAMHLVVRR